MTLTTGLRTGESRKLRTRAAMSAGLIRMNGWIAGVLLCAASGAYAASTVEMYKDPG